MSNKENERPSQIQELDENHAAISKRCTYPDMKRAFRFSFYNESLLVGMVDIRQVYLLQPEVGRDRLVYRAKGSAKRISYEQLTKGSVRKTFSAEEEWPDWMEVYKRKLG